MQSILTQNQIDSIVDRIHLRRMASVHRPSQAQLDRVHLDVEARGHVRSLVIEGVEALEAAGLKIVPIN